MSNKLWFILVVALLPGNSAKIFGQDIDPSKMVLVWSDEFNESTLDWNTWNIDQTIYNAMLSVNRKEDENVSNGNLFIADKHEPGIYHYPYFNSSDSAYFEYTAGDIHMLRSFLHGYFEIRAKIPTNAKGLVPAFWLYHRTPPGVGNKDEIDVFEIQGYQPQKFQCNIHYVDVKPIQKPHWIDYNTTYYNYHTYGVYWQQNKITFYYDRVPVYSVNHTYNYAMYVRLSLPANGDGRGAWDGPPDATTDFPSFMTVDYVRIYKDANCSQDITLPQFESAPYKQSTFIGHNIIGPENGSTFIVSTPAKLYANDSYIDLIASNDILLEPGFHAEANSNFRARIVDCNNLSSIQSNSTTSTQNVQASKSAKEIATGTTTFSQKNVALHVENLDNLYFKAYPNPSNGIFTLIIPGGGNTAKQLKVVDLQGRLIESFVPNNTIYTIDLSNLADGQYCLILLSKNKVYRRMITKD